MMVRFTSQARRHSHFHNVCIRASPRIANRYPSLPDVQVCILPDVDYTEVMECHIDNLLKARLDNGGYLNIVYA
jgi:hypothetical protein